MIDTPVRCEKCHENDRACLECQAAHKYYTGEESIDFDDSSDDLSEKEDREWE